LYSLPRKEMWMSVGPKQQTAQVQVKRRRVATRMLISHSIAYIAFV